MMRSVEDARRFIARARIPTDKRRQPIRTQASRFSEGKDEAAVTGSEIMSFLSGVPVDRRQSLSNSSLLAQLVAKQKIPDPSNIEEWYEAYFEVLTNIGWAIQETNFTEYQQHSDLLETHQAILAVATTLLGAAPTALALVKTTLDALQSMEADKPWITLFEKESHSARTARFQISVVEQGGAALVVATMAFSLTTRSNIRQVLFFRSKSTDATLRYYSGRIAIATDVLDALKDTLTKKLSGLAEDYIMALPPLK